MSPDVGEKIQSGAPVTTIKSSDMSDEMQKVAIEVGTTALGTHEIEKDIATYIKKDFDKRYGATWHCVVGKSFGSYCTHETGNFVYFYLGSIAILLFKAG